MNWINKQRPLIQRTEKSIVNEHVMQGLDRATQCTRWLKSQGFTVLNVSVGKRNPRIEIAKTRLCDSLDGVVYISERKANEPVRNGWVAHRFGCEVRWADEVRS